MSLFPSKASSFLGIDSIPFSRSQSHSQSQANAPSISGDSETTGTGGVKGTEKGLDVSVLKEIAKSGLIEALNSVQGAKTLVIDPSLVGPLGMIIEFSLLKQQAVDKVYWLEPGPLNQLATKNVVYLCRPKRKFMEIIADQIKTHQSSSQSHTYAILFTPRVTTLCTSHLQTLGIAGDVTTLSYPLRFIPLEEDVLSLEMETFNKEVWVDGDEGGVWEAGMGVVGMERIWGLIPRIWSKGKVATNLRHLLARHRHSDPALYADLEPSEQIEGMIIIDRAVDWVTPMLTQLTYEGLLDEFVGISNSQIEIDASLLTNPPNPPQAGTSTPPTSAGSTSLLTAAPKKKKHPLNSTTDKLFSSLRDCNFSTVGTRLSKTARKLESDYEERKRLKSVKEMKDFVGRLGGLQNEHQGLRLHTALSEILMPITRSEEFGKTLEVQQNLLAGYDTTTQLSTIEDLLNQELPFSTILRLLILYSLTCSGIRPKYLESIKREFLQAYGYHHLPLLINLEELGLLCKYPAPTTTLAVQNWAAVRKGFRLLVEEEGEGGEARPRDISYVYSGYAPLSCRIVQVIAQRNGLTGELSATGPSTRKNTTTTAGGANQQQQQLDQDEDDDYLPGSSIVGGGAGGSSSKGKEKMRAHPLTSWGDYQGLVDSLPGGVAAEERVEGEGSAAGSGVERDRNGRTYNPTESTSTKTTIVFFLGGCTYTEIAALRFMAKQTKGRKFLILTTGMINGTKLLKEFGQPDPVELKPSKP